MRFLILVMMIVLISGCDIIKSRHTPKKYQLSKKERLVNSAQSKIAQKLSKELNLCPCGSGGQIMHEIEKLSLMFDCFEPLDTDRARRLLVTAVEKFAEEINQNEELRPYLSNYPFEAKNIHIIIYIQDRKWKDFPGSLSVVRSERGILEYKMNDPESQSSQTICKETFDEALEKVHRRKEDPPLRDF